ncbi:hypothetical protein BKA63DRAFT_95823 [Paraphoma chrysanthemicola]|nr:hypothetical protein BKA63DRAFT_95823 [Paraphoma chrysanthemicola]
MPYIIYVPSIPRPYITNDPSIYMDAKTWGWDCESRPFSDSYCKAFRHEEDSRFEGERRTAQLDLYMITERTRRSSPQQNPKSMAIGSPKRHAKFDSVHSFLFHAEELLDSSDGIEV